jgi:hypothetical protein
MSKDEAAKAKVEKPSPVLSGHEREGQHDPAAFAQQYARARARGTSKLGDTPSCGRRRGAPIKTQKNRPLESGRKVGVKCPWAWWRAYDDDRVAQLG